jgi:hypothetical protein
MEIMYQSCAILHYNMHICGPLFYISTILFFVSPFAFRLFIVQIEICIRKIYIRDEACWNLSRRLVPRLVKGYSLIVTGIGWNEYNLHISFITMSSLEHQNSTKSHHICICMHISKITFILFVSCRRVQQDPFMTK